RVLVGELDVSSGGRCAEGLRALADRLGEAAFADRAGFWLGLGRLLGGDVPGAVPLLESVVPKLTRPDDVEVQPMAIGVWAMAVVFQGDPERGAGMCLRARRL